MKDETRELVLLEISDLISDKGKKKRHLQNVDVSFFM